MDKGRRPDVVAGGHEGSIALYASGECQFPNESCGWPAVSAIPCHKNIPTHFRTAVSVDIFL